MIRALSVLFLVSSVAASAASICTPELSGRPRLAPIDDPTSGRWQRFGRRLRVYWDGREEGERRVLVYWDAEPRFRHAHAYLREVAPVGAEVSATYHTSEQKLAFGPRTLDGSAWRRLAWARWGKTVALAKYEVGEDLIVWMLPRGIENALGIEVPVKTLFDDSFGRALTRLVRRSTTPTVSLAEAGTHVGALKEVVARDMAEYLGQR